MQQVSDALLETLAGPHRVQVQVTSRRGATVLYSGVPVIDGSVTVDGAAQCRRTLSLTVPARLSTGLYADRPALPDSPSHPLAAYGQELHVSYGVLYTDDSVEWLQAGVFRIDSTSGSLTEGEAVQVTGRSREAFLIDARFLAPRTVSGPSVTAIIDTLVHEVLPSVEVVVSTSRDARVPTTTYDEDRWGAITSLAESIGAVVYADPWGRIVVADAPSTKGDPVWTVRAGQGGVLVSASSSSSREGVYNAVVVRGESPSGDFAPLQGVEYDEDPTSPTRWGDPHAGRFGMVPRHESYPTVSTVAQARAVARGLLAQSVGAARTLEASSVPNPALEPGDLIHVIPDPDDLATVRAHIVDGYTLSLRAGGEFPIRTRDVRQVGA